MLWTGKLQKTIQSSPNQLSTYKNACASLVLKLKESTIRKLMGGVGGGRAKYKKKYSSKGKLNEKKNYACKLTLKNIHATI